MSINIESPQQNKNIEFLSIRKMHNTEHQLIFTFTQIYKSLNNPIKQIYRITIIDNRKFTLNIINASEHIVQLFTEREPNFHKNSLVTIESIHQLTDTIDINKITFAKKIEIYNISLEMIQKFKKILANRKYKKLHIINLNPKIVQYMKSRKLPHRRV